MKEQPRRGLAAPDLARQRRKLRPCPVQLVLDDEAHRPAFDARGRRDLKGHILTMVELGLGLTHFGSVKEGWSFISGGAG